MKNKTYKLIKKYPSLPSDWELNMEIGIGDNRKTHYSPCNGKYKDFYIDSTQVENNPEYWQEVYPVGTKVVDTYKETEGYTYEKLPNGKWTIGSIEGYSISENSIGEGKRFRVVKEKLKLDYEILSFKQESGVTDLWTKFLSGWCRNHNGVAETSPYKTTEEILNNHLHGGVKYSIHSVRRLSDGEIFTIGDEIKDSDFGNIPIRGFKIENNEMCVIYADFDYPLNKTVKSNPVLFTTEDGVKIKGNDKYYSINEKYWVIESPENTCKINYETYHKHTKW